MHGFYCPRAVVSTPRLPTKCSKTDAIASPTERETCCGLGAEIEWASVMQFDAL
ncbi:hypothetical protein NUV62_02630 [Acinetobacter venetianus]|nr:hypothetical protein [Acinetobacter venetianus]